MTDWKPKTVRDLINQLQRLDPKLIVVQSKDPEGNGFYPWSGDIGLGIYKEEDYEDSFSSHTYDTYIDEYGDEEIDESTERPVRDDEATAVCLWP